MTSNKLSRQTTHQQRIDHVVWAVKGLERLVANNMIRVDHSTFIGKIYDEAVQLGMEEYAIRLLNMVG